MSFPQIRYCLVCENVRPEQSGLTTMVGFYGIAPDVRIGIPDFSEPLPILAFLLISNESGQGDFEIQVRISDDAGNIVLGVPSGRVALAGGARRLNLGVNVTGLKLPQPGRYTLSLLVNGLMHFHTTFEAEQADVQPARVVRPAYPSKPAPSASH